MFTEDFGILQWFVFIILIVYTGMALGGVSFLRDPEKRIPRIESLDFLYDSEYGFILIFIRNVVIWVLIFICFKIVT